MKLFNRLEEILQKRRERYELVEHEFLDDGHVNNHGYNIPITLKVKLSIPKFYKEAEDDADYIKKNVRRWNRYTSNGELVSFVDAYLENYSKDRFGYILNPDKHIPTEEYIKDNFSILSRKEQYFGMLRYEVIKLSKYHTIYITYLANDIAYIVNVCNLNLDIKMKEIKKLLDIEYDYENIK